MSASIELLTTKQLAEVLSVSVLTLAEWRRLERGPKFTRLGKNIYYRAEDIRAWVEDNLDDKPRKKSTTGAHPQATDPVGVASAGGGHFSPVSAAAPSTHPAVSGTPTP
ncbi:MAG TPA: helix-turn-helix domain-containing protein [Ktedonobacterales bacterium]|nr:helix-turn-helix domain-containing protein [Ktedonobacterales bacterium]